MCCRPIVIYTQASTMDGNVALQRRAHVSFYREIISLVNNSFILSTVSNEWHQLSAGANAPYLPSAVRIDAGNGKQTFESHAERARRMEREGNRDTHFKWQLRKWCLKTVFFMFHSHKTIVPCHFLIISAIMQSAVPANQCKIKIKNEKQKESANSFKLFVLCVCILLLISLFLFRLLAISILSHCCVERSTIVFFNSKRAINLLCESLVPRFHVSLDFYKCLHFVQTHEQSTLLLFRK